MRYRASYKREIISLVERSSLSMAINFDPPME
jgi:hypothetical protein